METKSAKEYREKEHITDANFWDGNNIDFNMIYEFAEEYHQSQSKQMNERIKELEEVLNTILNAPNPFNENEYKSWVETARMEAQKALNK